jgi:hypothetical protein
MIFILLTIAVSCLAPTVAGANTCSQVTVRKEMNGKINCIFTLKLELALRNI